MIITPPQKRNIYTKISGYNTIQHTANNQQFDPQESPIKIIDTIYEETHSRNHLASKQKKENTNNVLIDKLVKDTQLSWKRLRLYN